MDADRTVKRPGSRVDLHLGPSGVNMVLWLLGAALLAQAAGFYLPGLSPVSFCEPGKDQVPDCKVNMSQVSWTSTMSDTKLLPASCGAAGQQADRGHRDELKFTNRCELLAKVSQNTH